MNDNVNNKMFCGSPSKALISKLQYASAHPAEVNPPSTPSLSILHVYKDWESITLSIYALQAIVCDVISCVHSPLGLIRK